MNKQINQTYKKINREDILNKKHYRVWFFTNEKIHNIFSKIEENSDIKRVFSIGGGGDFAFSLLSSSRLNQISEINVCDVRETATLSIDFKIALLKELEFVEFSDLFLRRKLFSIDETYKRIRETISSFGREFYDKVIEMCKKDNLLDCLKASRLWYGYSFFQIKNKEKYLPYLNSEERYKLLQKNLERIEIYCGDFKKVLESNHNDYYDLIYISNVLDSKQYCKEPKQYLDTIREKLIDNGILFVVAQDNPKKTIKLIEGKGFRLYEKELHKFNIIAGLFGHYSYSFLLFKKNGVK